MKPFNLIECIENDGIAIDRQGNRYKFAQIIPGEKLIEFRIDGGCPYFYLLDGRLNHQELIPEDKTLFLPEPGELYDPFDIAKYATGKYAVTTRKGKRVGELAIMPGKYPIRTIIDGHCEQYKLNGFYSFDNTPHPMDLVLRNK